MFSKEQLINHFEYGTMVIPVYDYLWQVKKISNIDTEIKKFERFEFVPLIV